MKNPIESTVINAISNSIDVPESSITAERTLNDLGFNSILAVQLFSKLQTQLGVETAPEELFQMSTVGEIVDYFENKAK
ncbi:acyl carrier protein [Chitinophaga polysaccharea]|uniref:acyl carrier protein n=1 Tax=Chitinophaga TaxID=79328 RepID=UPI00145573F3|nr:MULTISPECIES: acyl carrier protein [Chitinophaga]NLR58118.1 acyl carrier protein [Chitinophaga polysaccharea]NLU90656.1 acyl carrier protein [Chitinophaga sp. Ak27]